MLAFLPPTLRWSTAHRRLPRWAAKAGPDEHSLGQTNRCSGDFRAHMSTEVRRVSETITCLRRASYLTCSYIVRTASHREPLLGADDACQAMHAYLQQGGNWPLLG